MPRPRIREQTKALLEDVADEHDYSNLDRAIEHIAREAGYQVPGAY